MNGCIESQYACNTSGYPVKTTNGRQTTHHRYLYEQEYGPVGDLEVDHICRNRRCVNLDHLQAISVADNRARRILFRRFTPQDDWFVLQHQRLHAMTQHEIAAATGVSQPHVSRILIKSGVRSHTKGGQ